MFSDTPKPRMTPEEIEVRVWAFVVRLIAVMVFMISMGVLFAVAFEPQEAVLAPIDAVFLEILKAIAFMGVGTLGGIAGRKAVNSYANKAAEQEEE